MRRMNFRNHAEEWTRFRKTLLSCLIWWGIGTAIGLLFAIALDDSMQENLAYHLKTGVSYLIENEKTPITYFIRRCLA